MNWDAPTPQSLPDNQGTLMPRLNHPGVYTSRQLSVLNIPTLPAWQHDLNGEWIETVWQVLKPNAFWYWPDIDKAYQKVDNGWVEADL